MYCLMITQWNANWEVGIKYPIGSTVDSGFTLKSIPRVADVCQGDATAQIIFR